MNTIIDIAILVQKLTTDTSASMHTHTHHTGMTTTSYIDRVSVEVRTH